MPLRFLAAQRGWRITLRQLVPKLRCMCCGERPGSVMLEEKCGENVYRGGGPEGKNLRLR